MPLLGKRKYIDEKIGQLISKLDNLGYDTEEIKTTKEDIVNLQNMNELVKNKQLKTIH